MNDAFLLPKQLDQIVAILPGSPGNKNFYCQWHPRFRTTYSCRKQDQTETFQNTADNKIRKLSLSKLLVVVEVLKSVLLYEFIALRCFHIFPHHFRDQISE